MDMRAMGGRRRRMLPGVGVRLSGSGAGVCFQFSARHPVTDWLAVVTVHARPSEKNREGWGDTVDRVAELAHSRINARWKLQATRRTARKGGR